MRRKKLIGARPFSEKEFGESIGAPFLAGEEGFCALERLGLRPTFEVHGMPGGWIGAGSKTVIPARASLKASMRLVPNQDPEKICALFEKWARSVIPESVLLDVKNLGRGKWWIADVSDPVYEKARLSLRKGFGAGATGTVYEGGSIPIVPVFAETLGCPVVLLGFGMNNDNLHSPNERFALDRFFGGIRTLAHFYDAMAKS